jgi:hypothetical protein
VFEKRVLRRIFGPKRDEMTGGWRKLHNEELRDLYSSPSIIRIIKLRRMRWKGHVARMGEKRNVYRLLVGKPEGKRPLRRPRHRFFNPLLFASCTNTFSKCCKITRGMKRSRWIMLGWILERWDGVMWTGLIWLRIGTGGELL